jgi:nucleotide-binding universal stress UspA family protein
MAFENGLKTIVVATDLEGKADAALEYARRLATKYGARIVLAHGLDPMEYASVDALPRAVVSRLTEAALKVLDKLATDLLRKGIHTHSEIRQGAVAEMLVDVARQYEAGLMVIGTRGMEGAGPIVVGAIAEQLVRRASCPVLAVAADWNAGPKRPIPGGPVLLAMERNEAAAAAAASAYSLAKMFNRPLLVLHVRAAAEAAALLNPGAGKLEDLGLRLNGSSGAIADGSSAARQKVQVHCVVKDGYLADAIAEAIAENHPCILVAGVKRASGTPGPHGTAFALLSASRVPVLCVPPEAERDETHREVAGSVFDT